MARQRMVTRTVNVTTCEVMGLTISQAAVSTIKVQLNGTYADKDSALKAVKKTHETEDYKPTAIVSMTTQEILYGMTEEEFVKMARILPPRKDYTSNSETED